MRSFCFEGSSNYLLFDILTPTCSIKETTKAIGVLSGSCFVVDSWSVFDSDILLKLFLLEFVGCHFLILFRWCFPRSVCDRSL